MTWWVLSLSCHVGPQTCPQWLWTDIINVKRPRQMSSLTSRLKFCTFSLPRSAEKWSSPLWSRWKHLGFMADQFHSVTKPELFVAPALYLEVVADWLRATHRGCYDLLNVRNLKLRINLRVFLLNSCPKTYLSDIPLFCFIFLIPKHSTSREVISSKDMRIQSVRLVRESVRRARKQQSWFS